MDKYKLEKVDSLIRQIIPEDREDPYFAPSKFKTIFDEENMPTAYSSFAPVSYIFMISKEENLSSRAKSLLGAYGNIQICYYDRYGGELVIRLEFDPDRWDSSFEGNKNFAKDLFGSDLKIQLEHITYDNSSIEVRCSNVDNNFKAKFTSSIACALFVING